MATEHNQFKLAQRFFETDYTALLLRLLPTGFIWVFERYVLGIVVQDDPDATELEDWLDDPTAVDIIQDVPLEDGGSGNKLRRFLSCFANEFSLVEAAAWELLNQTDPGVAVDSLDDWERNLGLPETCYSDLSLTLAERQRQAHTKLFDRKKTTTFSFYETLAEHLGFDITIEEIPEGSQPRVMGVAIMGVEPMGGYGGNSILRITINSAESDSTILRCVFNEVKQAHVTIDWIEP